MDGSTYINISYTMVWGNTRFWLAAGCPLTPDIWTPTKWFQSNCLFTVLNSFTSWHISLSLKWVTIATGRQSNTFSHPVLCNELFVLAVTANSTPVFSPLSLLWVRPAHCLSSGGHGRLCCSSPRTKSACSHASKVENYQHWLLRLCQTAVTHSNTLTLSAASDGQSWSSWHLVVFVHISSCYYLPTDIFVCSQHLPPSLFLW